MRRRIVAAVALPVAAAGALAATLAAGGGAAGEQPSASTGTSATEVVRRRTLVEYATVDGTLGYDDPRPALDRLGGTLTWLPAAGATIRPGGRLFEVDGEPVILLDGRVPAWRTLTIGDEGADVRQLERNLAALGHDPGTVDDDYSSATAAAVRDWQETLGLEESGTVELGRVVFLPGARRVAEVTGSLGGSGSAANAVWEGGGLRTVAIADSGGATVPAETTPAPAATTPEPAETPRTTPPPTRTTPPPTRTTPPPTPPTPGGDEREREPCDCGDERPSGEGDGAEPSGPAATPSAAGSGGEPSGRAGSGDGTDGGDGGGGDGGGGAAGTEVLATTSTRRVVTADLDAADQGLARVGGRATVELPSGRRLRGRIFAVGTVAAASDDGEGGGGGDDGGATVPVTIELRSARGAGRLEEAPVVVELARTLRRAVLAVPVSALLARADGGYAVRVARGGGSGSAARLVEVPVEPGMFADGWVELTGGAVRAGDRVEVPR